MSYVPRYNISVSGATCPCVLFPHVKELIKKTGLRYIGNPYKIGDEIHFSYGADSVEQINRFNDGYYSALDAYSKANEIPKKPTILNRMLTGIRRGLFVLGFAK